MHRRTVFDVGPRQGAVPMQMAVQQPQNRFRKLKENQKIV